MTDIQQNLETVKAVLNKDPTFIEAYPHLFKVLNRLSRYLYDFLTDADEKKLIGAKSQQFYASCRYLANRFQYGTFQTWNRNINVFVALGLIERVPPWDVIITWRKREGLKEANFYTAPQYTDNLLTSSNRTAKKLLDNNYRLSAFNKIFLIKTLGQAFADTVYPDMRKLTKFSQYVTSKIEKFILWDIAQNGYTTKDRILQSVHIDTKPIGSSRHNILSVEFNRSITEICDKYDLTYRRANKELKDRFALASYKNVIYRE